MYITRNGVNLNGISKAAEKIGLKTLPIKLNYKKLVDEVPLPCILHWNQEHFVVLYETRNKHFFSNETIHLIADPGHGMVKVDKDTLMKCWAGTSDDRGVALLLEPTPEFCNASEEEKTVPSGFNFLFQYLSPYYKYIFQIMLGMLFGSMVSMLFPFLTQSLVD
jgi:ATP-binding cassette subfamily B protein